MEQQKTSTGEIIHVFAFRWKAGVTPADVDRARIEIQTFEGAIPGLIEVHLGQNLSRHGSGYTFVGFMRFDGQSSFSQYPHHPVHESLLQWLAPLIDAIELDIEV